MLAPPILEIISQYMYPMEYVSIVSMYSHRPPRTTFCTLISVHLVCFALCLVVQEYFILAMLMLLCCWLGKY